MTRTLRWSVDERHCPLVVVFIIVTFLLASVLVADAAPSTLFDKSLVLLRQRAVKHSPVGGYTFVVLGDSRDNDRVFRTSLSLALQQQPLFILHTGDFSAMGSDRDITHFLEIIEQEAANVPLFVVIGNHEQRKPFEKRIGPTDFTVDLPSLGTRIIGGDNSFYSLSASQRDWLKRQLLDPPPYTFVSFHIPPQTDRWRRHSFSDGSREMMRLLSSSRVARAFFGHVHVFDEDTIDGVHYVVTGGAGAPLYSGYPGVASHHIVVVRVEKGIVSHRMVKVPQ